MSTIKIDSFHGIAPRVHPTQLSDGMSVEAHNCRLKNNKLVPLRHPSMFGGIPVGYETINMLSETNSMYLWRIGVDYKMFLAFVGNVHFAESNLNDDEYNRVFVSGDTGLGDNETEPGVWLCEGDPDEYYSYSLVKLPLAIPRVRRAEGQRSTKSEKYVVKGIKTVGDINDSRGAEHPLTVVPDVNDVYGLSDGGYIEKGPNGGGLIVTAGQQIVWKGKYWEMYDATADITAALRYTYFFQTWVDPYGYESGVSEKSCTYERTLHNGSAFEGESTADYGWNINLSEDGEKVICTKGTGESAQTISFPTYYAVLHESEDESEEESDYASVDKYNHEGNDVEYYDGDKIIIAALKDDEVPDGGGTVANPEEGYKRRIYKVITGTETESVQFIAEFADDPWGEHTIAVKDEDAGEILTQMQSIPEDLTWMTFVAGGYYVGFCPSKPHTVMFSEVGYPHDWPIAYRYDVKDKIVGLAVTSNSVFVLTDNYPWVLSGTSPESMTVAKIAGPSACVSERSICVHKNAVFFASNVGVSMIYNDADAGTVCKNLTEQMFSKDQWNALNPSSCMMVQHDDALHLFFTLANGERKGYIIDLLESQNAITTHDEIATCLCVDNADDTLYFIRETEVA